MGTGTQSMWTLSSGRASEEIVKKEEESERRRASIKSGRYQQRGINARAPLGKVLLSFEMSESRHRHLELSGVKVPVGVTSGWKTSCQHTSQTSEIDVAIQGTASIS